jgi:hypothetical protein
MTLDLQDHVDEVWFGSARSCAWLGDWLSDIGEVDAQRPFTRRGQALKSTQREAQFRSGMRGVGSPTH